jgi:hypothetical protein
MPLPSYITVEEANTLAAELHGLSPAWANAADADKLKALTTATARVNASRRWQGSQYIPVGQWAVVSGQLEFPRVNLARQAVSYGRSELIDADPVDLNSLVPVVPTAIKLAVLWEADSLLKGARAARLQDQHDGLAGQSIGSASESYRPQVNGNGVPVLCAEADILCRKYQLRSGAML